jgi:heme-degrading monooxygenase HmoA
MAIFHVPLTLRKRISFYKLMGCGRNGTFDKTPDVLQWCILVTTNKNNFDDASKQPNFIKALLGGFINTWFFLFAKETFTLSLSTLTAHGTWDGKSPFGDGIKNHNYNGPIGVMTRATIRLSRFSNFWKHVDGVAKTLTSSPGFITSVGIGEIPWIKQATFSIWQTEEAMKAFAYKRKEHSDVVHKTKKEKWYSEDLFARFMLLHTTGTIKNKNEVLAIM